MSGHSKNCNIEPEYPNFFGERATSTKTGKKPRQPRPRRLWRDFPEEWELYRKHFVIDLDDRGFNVRAGYKYKSPWVLKYGWEKSSGGKVRHSDRTMSLRGKEGDNALERHLDGERWKARRRKEPDPNPAWLGVYGGPYTLNVCLDLDNHDEGRSIRYIDRAGALRLVTWLSYNYLRRLEVALSLPSTFDVITTFSDSLGLNLWHKAATAVRTKGMYDLLMVEATTAGLAKSEVYPMPPSAGLKVYKDRRCHRRPFGQGSRTLTPGGVIEPWREQLWHFDAPGPIPDLPQVVNMLLGLWNRQVEDLLAYRPRLAPDGWMDAYESQVSRIRAWSSGGTLGEDETSASYIPSPPEDHAGVIHSRPTAKAGKAKGGLPASVMALPRQDRVYAIATQGVPEGGGLNECLYCLAKHLIWYELDGPQAEDVARDVLARFALSRHNGMSERLSGYSENDALPKPVSDLIVRTVAKVVAHPERPLRKATYGLRIRDILCGEGPRNRYVPRNHQQPPMDHSLVYSSENSYREWSKLVPELIADGTLDNPLDAETEAVLRVTMKKGNAVLFARRVANFLDLTGGTTNIHTDLFQAFSGSGSPTTMTAWKKRLKDSGLLTVTDRRYGPGGKSITYRWGAPGGADEPCELLEDGVTPLPESRIARKDGIARIEALARQAGILSASN